MDAAFPRSRAVVGALAGIGAILMVLSVSGGAAAQDAAFREQLPDMEAVVPFKVSAFRERVGSHHRIELGFGSAGQNVGEGPLLVVGHRSSVSQRTLQADQYVDTTDGSTHGPQTVVPKIGVLRYVRSPDHSHFHFLAFMTYELRRASDHRLIGRDHKTGFCLGDRYRIGTTSFSPAPAGGARAGASGAGGRITYEDFDGECRKHKPRSLRVVEGIDPGKGDDYKPRLEGQSIDITRVRAGTYVLVHRVNQSRRIRESSYDNNASSLLLRIRPRRGRLPAVKVLRRCPGSDRCAEG